MKKLFILSLVVLGVGCSAPKWKSKISHDGYMGNEEPMKKEKGERWFGVYFGEHLPGSPYDRFEGLGDYDSTKSYGYRLVPRSAIKDRDSWRLLDTCFVVKGCVLNNSLFVRVTERFLEETKNKGAWDFKKQDSIWKAHLKRNGKNQ